MRESVAANLFNLCGGVFWLAAIAAFYFEETAGSRVPLDSLNGIALAAQIMRSQAALLEIGCCAAIVGTLFLGFAAVLKWQVEAINAADARAVS